MNYSSLETDHCMTKIVDTVKRKKKSDRNQIQAVLRWFYTVFSVNYR